MIQSVFRYFSIVAIALICSCGSIQYEKQIEETERAFAQAREQKAPERAPYEYYYAEAYLSQAREEAARSLYENAIRYAVAAQKYCLKASEIALARQKKRSDVSAIR